MKTLSATLLEKSIASAVSAIEIYNKPNFMYREETFSILMVNAWELLLKSKLVLDNDNKVECLYIKQLKVKKDGSKSKAWFYKVNRINNYMTIDINRAITILEQKEAIDIKAKENIELLIEIRDNAIHLVNKNKYLNKKLQEVGTASLKNYLFFVKEWFNKDLEKYNFYLMPLSFYNELDLIENISSNINKQSVNLLKRINTLEQKYKSDPATPTNITLQTQTKFVKATSSASKLALAVRRSNDENAIPITLSEEDIMEQYPWTYDELISRLMGRYSDFSANVKFHKIKSDAREEDRYAKVRLLDPKNPNGASKWYYNPNIINEFDKHYVKK